MAPEVLLCPDKSSNNYSPTPRKYATSPLKANDRGHDSNRTDERDLYGIEHHDDIDDVEYDEKVDTWATAILVHELITGSPPFESRGMSLISIFVVFCASGRFLLEVQFRIQ